MGNKPLVSICCITYNHQEYIRNTIEGFLKQEIEFPIEIIIHDDASTDNTQDIIKEYAIEDDRIKTILRKENIKSTSVPIFPITFQKACGKYIALCEGDDYWTDPQKLRLQVEFLERNPEYVLSVGGYEKNYKGQKEKIILNNVGASYNHDTNGFSFDLLDSSNVWMTKTLTAVFRKDAYTVDLHKKYKYFRDVHLFYDILKSGRGFYFKRNFGVYNVHSGGVHSLEEEEQKRVNTYKLFRELYQHNSDDFSRTMYIRAILDFLKYNFKKENIFEKRHLKLFKTSLLLVRSPKDFKWFLRVFIPDSFKGLLK